VTRADVTADELAVAPPSLGGEGSVGASPAEENATVDVGSVEYESAVKE
jgi:hypothetical protein